MRAAQAGDDVIEDARLGGVEMAALQQLENTRQLLILVDDLVRVVVRLEGLHLFHPEAEEEEILLANRVQDLDVGAVVGADGERPVHHELHVAGAGGFLSGRGDLLRQVGARRDHLHAGDPVVGNEGHPEPVTHNGIAVDDVGHVVDQLDDLLRHLVTGGRLAAEQDAAVAPVLLQVTAVNAVVEMDHVQHVEQLALVLVDALDLHVEQGVDREFDATLLPHEPGQPLLVVLLRLVPGLVERLFPRFGTGLEFFDLGQVADPAIADPAADERAHVRVGIGDPAPRRDTVGLIVEFLRPELVEVAEQSLLEQAGVELGHAVHRETADDGEVGHAHRLGAVLLDDGHAPAPLGLARPVDGHLLQEAGIDLVDDLQQPGQQAFEELHRPAFQRLRQQGVVGVGHGAPGDLPGLVPLQVLLVHEDAHQFGHRDRRVGIVELEDVVLGEGAVVVTVHQFPLAHHVLEAGGSEQVMLAQTQLLAVLAGVVGIEHHGYVLGLVLGGHRLGVAAGIEFIEIEDVGSGGFPQPQRVDHAVLVAGDRYIVGNGQHVLGVEPAHPGNTLFIGEVLGVTAEIDDLGVLQPFEFPGIAVAKPVIGLFHLVAVLDVLAEHAVFVAQPVTEHRQFQRGAAVHEAGGETAQAAVPQSGIVFVLLDLFQFQGVGLHRLLCLGADAHVEQVIAQRTADEKLHGEVEGPALSLLAMLFPGIEPVGHDAVTQGERQGLVEVIGVAAEESPQVMDQVAVEIVFQRLGIIGEAVGRRKHAEVFSVVHGALRSWSAGSDTGKGL